MQDRFGVSYEGLPVRVTGHTGFKGSWLSRRRAVLQARTPSFQSPG
jgi:hypothetical protein